MSNQDLDDMENCVAIIGMAGRFPGADNVEEFWQILKEGKETTSVLTDEQLRHGEYDFEKLKNNANFVRTRGILKDVDMFDAEFFGFNPREASVLDPQQRVWLETAWQALENASYAPEKYSGAIGVFAGSYTNTYLLHNLCKDREYIENLVRFRSVDAYATMLSNDKDFLPTRTSYKFNLKGPSINVQTACSTSLVAVAQACQSLLQYESDICLAGGVCISLPQEKGYLYQEGAMVSPDGHCRSFDADAKGTVFSSGVGAVVLKRLDEAVADGDNIRAVIRGSAINNDGSLKVSYTAPSVTGQAEVVAMAQAMAGVDPETISYIEAHGTATPLGDPIEVAALTQAFRTKTDAKQFCGLGSAKTNVGHMDAAAGVTGLIKTVLAMENRQIPASLHYKKPNPQIDFENSPFYVVDKLQQWKPAAGVLRAGVSALGVGGTNVHVIVEEAPEADESGDSRDWQVLMLSARNDEALAANQKQLLAHLESHRQSSLADISYTLQVGRTDFNCRRFFVCRDQDDAVHELQSDKSTKMTSQSGDAGDSKIVFMFPGQGAQHVNMGRELYENENTYRQCIDDCAEILKQHLDLDLREILYPQPGQEEPSTQRLKQTGIAQPALFVTELALAKLWMEWGLQPAAMIGHSIGEYVAACVAGVFSLEDALWIIANRAKLMQQMPAGSMLAVRLSEQQLKPYLGDGVSLAASNAPAICVVSGPDDRLAEFEKTLKAAAIETIPLHTSHAFHSEMMQSVVQPFTDIVAQVQLKQPEIPFISSLTGSWINQEQVTEPAYWAQQLRHAVQFSQGIRELQKEDGRIYLEVGPSNTLATAVRQHAKKEIKQTVISSLGHAQKQHSAMQCMLTALGQLWQAGTTIDWQGFYKDETRHRVELPAYSFQRKRYWIDPPASTARASETVLSAADHADSFSAVNENEASSAAQSGVKVVDNDRSIGRKQQIVNKLAEIIFDLSGLEFSESDHAITFVEMGLDSLFLTQACSEFQKQFDVKIRFRQLLEDMNTLDLLADYLLVNINEDIFPQPGLRPTNAVAAELDLQQLDESFAGLARDSDATLVERVFNKQFQIMTQQLALLGHDAASASQLLQNVNQAAIKSLDNSPTVHTRLKQEAIKPAAIEVTNKRFGPYKPVEKTKEGGLTSGQQSYLDNLIQKLNQRTATSKATAARYRKVQADPRNITGFRLLWKDLVYQIVSERSSGSKLWDIDGNQYIDITMGFGPVLLGHSPSFVVEAINEQVQKGFEIGPQAKLAGKVAELISEFTGLQRVSFCNTGSEAVMAALRMARTVTGRSKVVYFTNDYHGTFDEVLGRAQVLKANLRTMPATPGVTQSSVDNAIILAYGTDESLEIIKNCADELAAVLVEPVQSRCPHVRPEKFLKSLRNITEQSGTALIFDEVITGFRVSPGGMQAEYGIKADLATYGKVIGGGLPIGVVAGDARFMDSLDGGDWQYGDDTLPEADLTFFAGTFVRHPLALAAAFAVLSYLKEQGPELQRGLNIRTTEFANELNNFFELSNLPVRILQYSSWFRFDVPADLEFVPLLSYVMLEKGIYIRDIAQNCFFSTAHTDSDIRLVKEVIMQSVIELRDNGFLPTSQPEQTDVEHSTPLSDVQKEIWITDQMGTMASCSFNESIVLHLSGLLNFDLLQQSYTDVIKRHDSFCVRMSADGSRQFMIDDLTTEIDFVDISDLTEDEKSHALDEFSDSNSLTAFDLIKGPLFRASILKLDKEKFLFYFTAHHIIFDGWSAAVFLHELSAVYSALCTGETIELPVADSYRAYTQKLKSEQFSQEANEALEYWSGVYKTLPQALRFPTDRSRPAVRSYLCNTAYWTFSDSAYSGLKKTAARHGATLYATLFSAFTILLSRITGQNDIVVGSLVAGQARNAMSSLVGHCVSVLPVRTEINQLASFSEFIDATKTNLLDAFDHQQCSLINLLKQLSVERVPGRTALVEVLFNLDQKIKAEGFYDLKSSLEDNKKRATSFDLFFNLRETAEGLEAKCEHSDIFDVLSVQRWFAQLDNILIEISVSPETKLCDLNLLSDMDAQLLEEWNQTQAEYPSNAGIHQLFIEQAESLPDSTAVVFNNDVMSYQQLHQQSDQLAYYLSSIGVESETLVAVCLDRSIEMLMALIAIHKAGGAYLPLDPDYPSERIEYMLTDSQAKLVLTSSEYAAVLPSLDADIIIYDKEQKTIDQAAAVNLSKRFTDSNSLAYVIYTSGSTGKPKGVEITHQAAVNFLSAMAKQPGITKDDNLLAVTTLSFDISVLELFLPLSAGATTVIADKSQAMDGLQLAQIIKQQNITMMQATPATWYLMLASGWQGSDHIRLLCGGEAMPQNLVSQLLPKVKELWNMYGPTEATVWTTCAQILDAEQLITVGKPVANTQAYILDAELRKLPVGVAGELYIGGAGLARGYRNHPELTRASFLAAASAGDVGQRIYRTGDLARYLSDGRLECLGRADSQVKLRGYRIEMGEIESNLDAHPSVKQCVAIVREDQPADQRLAAYYVCRAEMEVSPDQLRQHLRTLLPEYMMPQFFIALDVLPLTPAGKIDRKSLPKPADVQTDDNESLVKAQSETEIDLVKIWRDALGVASIGINSNFFELGGHSLLASQVWVQICHHFEIELPLYQLFLLPTVAELAQEIDKCQASQSSALAATIPGRDETQTDYLSFAQQRLWYIEQIDPGTAMYNLPSAFELRGELDLENLNSSLQAIIKRHESLRTVVGWQNNEPVQIVKPEIALDFPLVDLQQYQGSEQDRQLKSILQSETKTPFDLEKGPLFKTRLIKLEKNRHVLFFMPHHIIWDGLSFDVFVNELIEDYESSAAGNQHRPDELPVQYADFSAWNRQWVEADDKKTQLEYWKHKLAGELPVLDMPLDMPRPSVMRNCGDTEQIVLPAQLSVELEQLAKQMGTTLFVVMLSAINVLIYRYSAQRDIIVGLPVHGRNRPEFEYMLGLFVGVLISRLQLRDDMSFRALIAEVRDTYLKALENQDIPFEKIVEQLNPPRDLSRTPVYQCLFTYQDHSSRRSSMANIEITQIATHNAVSAMDLSFWVTKLDDGLSVGVEYNTDLFKPGTVKRLLNNFHALLESVLTDAGREIKALNILSPQESLLLEQWQSGQAGSCKRSSVVQSFEKQAANYPDRTSVMSSDAELSYRQLNESANQLANYLLDSGVSAGDFIGVSVDRSAQMLVTLLGILKTGAAYVPLDPEYPAERLSYIVKDSGLRLILTQSHLAAQLEQVDARLISLDSNSNDISACSTACPDIDFDDKTTAYVIYTSGSTGHPKGVLIAHSAMWNFISSMSRTPGLTADDTLLAVTTISFDISVLEMFVPLCVGAKVVIANNEQINSAPALIKLIEQFAVSVMQATPATWRMMLAAGWTGSDNFKSLCGGEAMPSDLAAELLPRVTALWNMYGPTETTVWSTCYQLTDSDSTVLIGKPIDNTTLYVLDANLQKVP
ncbi:MAG: amino acid adenylation domain-containing protein, partial [Gammaproteobacteria bacterium]|nr:amino acid adenylation domain-containing protein [Gammaproteobacteria bacterium]